MRYFWFFLSTILFIQIGLSCGKIPNDPNTEIIRNERTYENKIWGFRITPPDQWGLSATNLELQRDDNGKPKVEVRIYRTSRMIGGQTLFEPTFYLRPRALSPGITLDSLVLVVEKEFQERFQGYRTEEKNQTRVGKEEAVEWKFQVSPFGIQDRVFSGSRFLSTVLIHGREWYFMLGTGEGPAENFPVEEYRQIVSTLTFF